MDALDEMSADCVTTFNSKNVRQLKENIGEYDVVINAASLRRDSRGRWIYALIMEDLDKLKPGALLIDLGINIRQSGLKPGSIYRPIQRFNRGANLAYVIDHVPTLDPLRASTSISEDVCPYIDDLTRGYVNATLKNAVIINRGRIKYQRLGY
jgi:alanine dehydrogenase